MGQELLSWLLFPLLLPSAPQLTPGSQTQECSCPSLSWILSLSLQRKANPPGFQAQLELWKAQPSLWGPRKAEFLPMRGFQQLVGISHSHWRNCSSQGLFFLTCKEMIPPCKVCQPFPSPRGFSVRHPLVFTPRCQLRQEGGSWGRARADHAKWSGTQIQGFAFKQIPHELWSWRHPQLLEKPISARLSWKFPRE